MKKPRRRKQSADTKITSISETEFMQLFQEGTRLLQEGESTQAILPLEQAYTLNRTDYDVALNLSGAYIVSGRFKLAIPILEGLGERYPDRPHVWTNLGAAYLGNPVLATDEQQQRAIAAFRRALTLDPEAHSVAYNIGLIYRDRQEKEDAAYWFQQAIAHNPDDRHAHNQLRLLSGEDVN